jgi:hypothetical protein
VKVETQETKLRRQAAQLAGMIRKAEAEIRMITNTQEFPFAGGGLPKGFELMNRRNKVNALKRRRETVIDKLRGLR